ncbi:MAG TPA: phosphoesterase, partial [Candidatus Berkiella sp.]|nr:phosphoesterase [Candidatus Berkiella sp.]
LDEINDFELTDEAALIKVLANLRSGRALRLMQFLDVLKPGTASKLLIYAEEQTKDAAHKNRYADLFLKRNLAFERLQLLGRVFAPERINLV